MDYTDATLINVLNLVEHLRNVVEILEERLRFAQARQDAFFVELSRTPEGAEFVEHILNTSVILANAAPAAIDLQVSAKWDVFLLEAKSVIQHHLEHPETEQRPN